MFFAKLEVMQKLVARLSLGDDDNTAQADPASPRRPRTPWMRSTSARAWVRRPLAPGAQSVPDQEALGAQALRDMDMEKF